MKKQPDERSKIMRRIIAGILFVIFMVPLCTTGLAVETGRVETVLEEAERLAAVADESGDYAALIPVVETFYSDVLPDLTEDQIVDIIEDDTHGATYKQLIIDMYSLAVEEGVREANRDIASVDGALLSLIVPGEELSVMAMASLSDPMVIPIKQVKEMLELGNDDEKVSSLKLLCSRSATEAILEIEKIMANKETDKRLYDAAINFLPRLIGEANGLSEAYVISKIKSILEETNDEYIQITCVQALMEIGSEEALSAVYDVQNKLPAELVSYCARKSGTQDMLQNISTATTLSSSVGARGATNRLGNVLYRDGVSSLGVEIDWHAGLVGHASGPFYQSGEWVIHHPGGSAVVQYDTFTTFLTDKNGDVHNDMGEFYLSTVSQSTAYDIFYTAHDLTNEAIAYTFSPMLRASKSSGTIEPSDITKIRCDGVVEYCYEYNGVRLQGLSSDNLWNISTVQGAEYHPASYRPSAQSQCFDREVSH